jgi:uncharacterized protein (TIGR02996 family)
VTVRVQCRMSDRDALLEAVFSSPADDAPRLVYADWLDEHGEPAQAAFIRAQIDLAHTEPDTAKLDRVAERLFGLWDQFLAELGPIAAGVMLLPSDFRRGFVDTPLHLLVSAFRDQSPHWWPRLPVRAVSIDLAPWNVQEFVRVPYLARLRELVLAGDDIHGKIVPHLVKCRLWHALRVLDLSQFNLGQTAAEILAGSDAFAKLEELRLPYSIRPTRGIGRLLRQRYGDVCRF